jgi:recombination protein U
MAYFSSRGLRGSAFEELINMTNLKYRDHGIGLIQKIPTPIKPVELDVENHNIKKAYFEERSTVDYIGIVQGYAICFDAKETNLERFPLRNIHQHQIDFMNDFSKQEGIAFLIIRFSQYNKNYFVPFEFIVKKIDDALNGGKKSIHYNEFNDFFEIDNKDGYVLHYIEALDLYLHSLDTKDS